MIVMITAKDAEEDKVRGFEAGAAGRLAHPEAIAGEVVGKRTHDHLVVLDYQDLRCTGYQSIYSCWIRPRATTSIDAASTSFILLTQL
jgi:PleD family two-component response regulator